jgi:hypothetical protein
MFYIISIICTEHIAAFTKNEIENGFKRFQSHSYLSIFELGIRVNKTRGLVTATNLHTHLKEIGYKLAHH